MAKQQKSTARLFYEEMTRLPPGHDWTNTIKAKYAELTQTEILAELGQPAQRLNAPNGDPIARYIVGTGFLDLRFDAHGRLSGAHHG